MSLAWYARRLANMSPAEILHRVEEQRKRSVSRRKPYGWASFTTAGSTPPVLPGLRDALLRNMDDDLAAAIRASATALLAGRYAALGRDWPERSPQDLFPADIWRLDPETRMLWPPADRFCFDIPYRHERERGDIKYVWEFNRLQHLQPLAALVALDNDERALTAIRSAIVSWHDANPPFRGLHWNSGIELAMRCVSLLVVTSLCGDRLGADLIATIRGSLSAHVYWLSRYPSKFSSANNHLVAEAMGEFLVALAMPDLPGAKALVRTARATLEREVGLQIFADGAPAEQSPTYGAFTAEMLLLAMMAGTAANVPFAAIVADRLSAFLDYVRALALPDGDVPRIGDDDEGRVIASLVGPDPRYPVRIANAIAAVLRKPGVAVVPLPSELSAGVFGTPASSLAAAQGLTTFSAGGTTIVREDRAGRAVQLVLDHGPLGYLSIAAHGHADVGSITLALDGSPILVDPGTYLYHAGGAWRDWMRGTRSHNTLAVAGADQSVISGPFNWSEKANGALVQSRSGPDWRLGVQHDGYRKRFGLTHERTIAPRAAGLVISDRLLPGPASSEVEIVFQFAPGISLRQQGERWLAIRAERVEVEIAFDAAGQVSVCEGEAGPAGGWVSPAFGVLQAACRLTWSGVMPVNGLTTHIDFGQTG